MPCSPVRAVAAYQQVQVSSRSPVELVVLLYDGALASLEQARAALAGNNLLTKRDAISRTLAILGQLQGSLNLEAGGEVAARLDALYAYVIGRVSDANVTRRAEGLDEAIRLLATLREGWAGIASPALGTAPSRPEAK